MYQHSDTSFLEKHLLSLIECGCYINTQDIIELGTALGIDLAYKRRLLLLQSLFLHVKTTAQESLLALSLETLLNNKKEALFTYAKNFPHTRIELEPLFAKIEATKRLIHHYLRSTDAR